MSNKKTYTLRNEPLYGDTIQEQAIPDILEKKKNPHSKARILRELYGNQVEPTQAEIEELKKVDNEGQISEYGLDLFRDFLKGVKQSQPYGDGNSGKEREYLQFITDKGTYSSIGRKPTPEEESLYNIQAVTDIPNYKGNILFDMHSHPEEFDSNPSPPDALSAELMNSYRAYVSSGNEVTKYYEAPQILTYSSPHLGQVPKDDLDFVVGQIKKSVGQDINPDVFLYNSPADVQKLIDLLD